MMMEAWLRVGVVGMIRKDRFWVYWTAEVTRFLYGSAVGYERNRI